MHQIPLSLRLPTDRAIGERLRKVLDFRIASLQSRILSTADSRENISLEQIFMFYQMREKSNRRESNDSVD